MYFNQVQENVRSRVGKQAKSLSKVSDISAALSQVSATLTKSVENNFGRYSNYKTAKIILLGTICAILLAGVLAAFLGNFWAISIILLIVSATCLYAYVKVNNTANMNTLLNGYLSERVSTQIMREQTTQNDVCTVYATVLFADIRAFTQMTETADNLDLFRELNAYYDVVDTAVTAFGGTINKFGGDSVLALFGATTPHPDHGAAAMNAAAAIVEGLVELNQGRMARHRAPFRIGIGVQSGEMVVGHLGSRRRREYTVLGDCVNVASRLSDMSKESPFYSIFVGDETIRCTRQIPTSLIVDKLGETDVRGRSKKITTYAVTPLLSYGA